MDELLPAVAGAPNLGGHNRSGESMKAVKAKQKQLQQMQPPAMDPATSGALQRRAGAGGNVAQVPQADSMRNTLMGVHEAAWEQAPILVRVRHCFAVRACHHLHMAESRAVFEAGLALELLEAIWHKPPLPQPLDRVSEAA